MTKLTDEELIKSLRICSKRTSPCTDCGVSPLTHCEDRLMELAADRLEELINQTQLTI